MSLDGSWCLCSDSIPPRCQKLNIELNTVRWLYKFVLYILWQVPGVGNTGMQRKLSSYLFNMCVHVWSKLNIWLWLASLSLLPITDPHLGGSESINFPYCSARIHWRELLLEGNEVSRGINGGVKEWTETIRLLQYLFSLCHLGSHYFLRNAVLQLKLSNAKWRLYFLLQHGRFDKERLESIWKTLSEHVLPANVAANQPVFTCFQSFQPRMMQQPRACSSLPV